MIKVACQVHLLCLRCEEFKLNFLCFILSCHLSTSFQSNNPQGRAPRALPVGEWELAHRASSIACVLERVPRALPVGIYEY